MDNLEFYDLYDIWYEPSWLVNYWLHGVLLIGVIIIVSMIMLWYLKRRKKDYSHYTLQTLNELYKTVDKDPQLAYCNLITAIKKYMAQRFLVSSLGQTDLEFSALCEQLPSLEPVKKDLQQLLHESYIIKYTPSSIKPMQVKCLIDTSISFVKKTFPEKNA